MRTIRITITTIFLLIGLSLFAGETNKPIVEFKPKSAHISSGGALPSWDAGFRKKFDSDIEYLVKQLQSNLVDVRLEGESNFKSCINLIG